MNTVAICVHACMYYHCAKIIRLEEGLVISYYMYSYIHYTHPILVLLLTKTFLTAPTKFASFSHINCLKIIYMHVCVFICIRLYVSLCSYGMYLYNLCS